MRRNSPLCLVVAMALFGASGAYASDATTGQLVMAANAAATQGGARASIASLFSTKFATGLSQGQTVSVSLLQGANFGDSLAPNTFLSVFLSPPGLVPSEPGIQLWGEFFQMGEDCPADVLWQPRPGGHDFFEPERAVVVPGCDSPCPAETIPCACICASSPRGAPASADSAGVRIPPAPLTERPTLPDGFSLYDFPASEGRPLLELQWKPASVTGSSRVQGRDSMESPPRPEAALSWTC